MSLADGTYFVRDWVFFLLMTEEDVARACFAGQATNVKRFMNIYTSNYQSRALWDCKDLRR